MNRNFLCLKKRFILIIIIPILIVLAYWLKCQIGINFFSSFSIGSHFPFKYLANNVIVSAEPGILLEENFNKKRFFKRWSNLWMREHEKVTMDLSLGGLNGSKCLLIRNVSKGSWVYSHRKLIKVKKGDKFYYEGFINIKGDDLYTYLSVATFDENKNVIVWNLFKEKEKRTSGWIRVEKQFNISDSDIRYIKFRLVGVGNGEYRFDNIIFRKLE